MHTNTYTTKVNILSCSINEQKLTMIVTTPPKLVDAPWLSVTLSIAKEYDDAPLDWIHTTSTAVLFSTIDIELDTLGGRTSLRGPCMNDTHTLCNIDTWMAIVKYNVDHVAILSHAVDYVWS